MKSSLRAAPLLLLAALGVWTLDAVIDSLVFQRGDLAVSFIEHTGRGLFSRITLVLLAIAAGSALYVARRHRREALDRLAGSEARFEAMAAAAADGVVLMDADGNIEFWNAAAERMFGRPAGEAIGRNLHDMLCPPDQRGDGVERFADVGYGANVTCELTALGPGGVELPVEVSISGFLLGGRRHAVGIIRDVSDKRAALTEIKRAYERIEQANREWTEAFDAVRSPMFLHDGEGRVMRANRAYAARAGVPVTELRGRFYWELFPRGEGPLPGCSQVLRSGSDEVHEQVVTAAGEVFHSHGFAARDELGRFRWSVHILEEVTGEAAMRKALEESRTMLAAAQRIAHIGHWDRNLLTGELVWSDELFRIFGLAPQQQRPSFQEFVARVYADDRAALESAVRTAVELRQPLDTEYRIVRTDGCVRVLHAQGEVTYDGGRPVRMFGTAHDITGRKRAEERIATLSCIHALLSAANKAIARAADQRELFAEICRVAATFRGVRMAWIGERVGRTVVPVASAGHVAGYLDDVVLEMDNPGHSAGPVLRALQSEGYVVYTEVSSDPRMLPWRDDALARGYHAVAAFAFSAEGETAGIMALYADRPDFFNDESVRLFEGLANDLSYAVESLRNRSRRQAAEAALRQTHKKLALHMERTPLAVVELDPLARITLWNGAAERIFGYRPEEVFGRPWDLLLPESSRAASGQFLTELLAGRSSAVLVTENVAADGRTLNCEWYLTAVTDGEGQVSGVMALANDITELIQSRNEVLALNAGLEERVRARTRELEAVNHELESFAYSVSHDLRAPLRSIDGFSGLLLKRYHDQLDDTGRDYLTRVRKATGRMGELIDDLLKLSRVTRAQMALQEVDLSAMADTLMREIRDEDPARALEWRAAGGLVVRADPHLLRIVLENLLRNAWKFTAGCEPARIELGVAGTGGERVFYLRDNGAGFDMRYAEKLFGPFQRLHSVDEFPGTGVGLATVHRILARHGGRIWAEAKPDEGATFFFTLEPAKG